MPLGCSLGEPVPYYGHGIFLVHRSGLVDQLVIFDYYDPERHYWRVAKDHRALARELATLSTNMQGFLDEEEVVVNGARVYPVVEYVDLGFRGREDLPYVLFHITFAVDLVPGLNVYEDRYGEEVAEYDYRVEWVLPPGSRFARVDVGADYVLRQGGRVLQFQVSRGTRVRGYERLEFVLG